MINYFDESGRRIPARENIPALGARNAHRTATVGAHYFVPFNSMHLYQRENSIWANQYQTSVQDYAKGFDSKRCEILSAFIRYDCERDRVDEMRPTELPVAVRSAAEFGDDWAEPLTPADIALAERYFKSVEHLAGVIDFVNLRVGGREYAISLGAGGFRRGVTFEAPCHSLVTALRYEIFLSAIS